MFQVVAGRVGFRHGYVQEGAEADDGTEDVVEVVRYPSRELAYCFHFLGVLQLCGKVLLFGFAHSQCFGHVVECPGELPDFILGLYGHPRRLFTGADCVDSTLEAVERPGDASREIVGNGKGDGKKCHAHGHAFQQKSAEGRIHGGGVQGYCNVPDRLVMRLFRVVGKHERIPGRVDAGRCDRCPEFYECSPLAVERQLPAAHCAQVFSTDVRLGIDVPSDRPVGYRPAAQQFSLAGKDSCRKGLFLAHHRIDRIAQQCRIFGKNSDPGAFCKLFGQKSALVAQRFHHVFPFVMDEKNSEGHRYEDRGKGEGKEYLGGEALGGQCQEIREFHGHGYSLFRKRNFFRELLFRTIPSLAAMVGFTVGTAISASVLGTAATSTPDFILSDIPPACFPSS